MKKIKIVVIGLIVIVVLAVGAGVALLLSLNSIVKAGVEQVGPRLTGVPITLGSVNISILSGSGELTGIVIGNPPGFKTPNAFELDRVRIKLVPMSIFSDTIHIQEVLVDGPRITYELANGTSNLAAIQKNVADKMPKGGADKPKPEEEEGGGKKLIIDDLQLNNTRLGVSASLLGGQQLDVLVPDIRLTDIGKAEGGASPAEVLNQVFGAIVNVVRSVASGAGDLLKSGGSSLKDASDSTIKSLKGIFGGKTDAAE